MANKYKGFDFKTCFNGLGFIPFFSWTAQIKNELEEKQLSYSWWLVSLNKIDFDNQNRYQKWSDENVEKFRSTFVTFMEYGYDRLGFDEETKYYK